MAHTLKAPHGKADASPSVSGTEARYIIGPPVNGAKNYQSRWVWQSGTGSNRVYRWDGDEPTTSTSPAGFTHTPSN